MNFNIEFHEDDSHSIISVAGELDIETSPRLLVFITDVIDSGYRDVVIDFAGLEFLDSSGIRTLVASADELAKRGGTLSLRSLSPRTRAVLDLTNLTEKFKILDSAD